MFVEVLPVAGRLFRIGQNQRSDGTVQSRVVPVLKQNDKKTVN